MIIDALNDENCLPLIIGDGPSQTGPRIGGAPPEGVSSVHGAEAHYLLTLALERDGGSELSIFLHPDWEDVFADHSRTLYSQEEAWVELILHKASARGQDNSQPLLTPHPLLVEPVERDRQGDDVSVYDEPGAPLWQHKLGGKPYFIRYKAKLVDAIREIEQRGYRQLLQLTFPGPKDADIAGDWPFAGGIFYLFFKIDSGQYHWYYGWLF